MHKILTFCHGMTAESDYTLTMVTYKRTEYECTSTFTCTCMCVSIHHTHRQRGSRKRGRETERIGERLILKKVTTKKG